MIISEQKILKEYYFIYGFDFNDKRQIEAVKNSLGFQRYVLCIKVEKFKELLWEEIKNIKLLNWIRKVCKKK